MDLVLAKRFLLGYLPKEGHLSLQEVFEMLESNPVLLLNTGALFHHLNYFHSENKQVSVAAVNGIIYGLAMAHCMEIPGITEMMESYIAQDRKAQGENVIQFLDKKGAKK